MSVVVDCFKFYSVIRHLKTLQRANEVIVVFCALSQQWHDDYRLFRTVFVYLLTGLEHYQHGK